ncbi:hypothetical protein GOP47_0010908 [Adiantum capillus-veneris]|uniref:Uncharacterized protein n=1 Tax=Adiantum capillus-veneris TaxID=13818 RepID=A0A9D4ZI97_ADICA|nr:hypothetical protein GOP47_0010908 [Adiantum capillus-veneris]
MAEPSDDWPSLAPIRTSCSASSSSIDLSSSFHSIASSGSHHLSLARRSSICTERSFPSPSSSSSSSSHLKSFLSSSSTTTSKGPGLLSKCLPPRPINAGSRPGFPRQSMSGSPAARLPPRPGSGGAFQSFASFPGARGSAHSAAPAAASASALTLHSAPLHGNGTACKGHLINLHAFTMIPAAAVGKKKPLDYISDEPTSPEVTCMGRVRKSKNSTCAWDALNANDSEKLPKKKKKKKTSRQKIEHPNPRDMDLQLAASIPRPLCMDPSNIGAAVPKWRKIISLFKDIRDMHTPHLQIRKFMPEDFMINLDRLRRATQRSRIATALPHNENQIDERETEINAVSREVLNYYVCPSGEGGGVGSASDSVLQEDAVIDDVAMQGMAPPAPAPPPNACLLLIKNKSGGNKVFHDDDDSDNSKNGEDDEERGPRAHPPSHPPALKALSNPSLMPSTSPSASQPIDHKWNKKQLSSLWKSKTFNSSFIKAFVGR